MSITSHLIECSNCEYRTTEIFAPILVEYVLPDGRRFTSKRGKGWCYNCDNYSDLEHIDNIKDIMNEKDELYEVICDYEKQLNIIKQSNILTRYLKRNEYRKLIDIKYYSEQKMAELNIKVDWIRMRKSPPRCLKCHSTNTVPIHFENGISVDFKHKCGGMLYLKEHPNRLRFNVFESVIIVDVDGNLIQNNEGGNEL